MAENPRIEELRRRVQADPASIAFAALAEEFRRVGRHDEAVETCRTGLLRHPAYLSARVTLGRALIELGDFDAAREELQTVLKSAPENLAAIRGLAQIHERLGHSTEMDPHLADLMKTMHEESLAAAALAPPAPPEPEPSFAPEPSNPMAPQPPPAFESLEGAGDFPLDDSLDAAVDAPVTDPFAAFAPKPSAAPAQDLSFDLSTAFTVQPKPKAPFAEPVADLMTAPFAEPVELHGNLPEEFAAEPAFEAFAPAVPEPRADFDLVIDPEPEVESEPQGPDPEVLATLARLERFLGAIESLRA